MVDTQESSKFLTQIFLEFFERTEPHSSIQKPVCIKNTHIPPHIRYQLFISASLTTGIEIF